jgi:hypothetical protein
VQTQGYPAAHVNHGFDPSPIDALVYLVVRCWLCGPQVVRWYQPRQPLPRCGCQGLRRGVLLWRGQRRHYTALSSSTHSHAVNAQPSLHKDGWRPNLPDEADNHLIELALAGGAQAIVTHNLRGLRGGELLLDRLRVLTPAQCLKEWT